MKIIDEASQAWLQEKARNGALPKALVDALMAKGYDRKSAQYAVQSVYATRLVSPSPQAQTAATPSGQPYEYDQCPVPNEPIIHAYDRDVFVRMRLDRPQVITFDNVLSEEECQELVWRGQQKLSRSTTFAGVHEHRTSDGMFIPLREDAFIERIDRRMAGVMNAPVEHAEAIQILRYRPTQEYGPHFDFYFHPEHSSQLKTGGQRTATLVVYLTDVEAGGETTFPHIGLSIVPKRGSAVYFRYSNHKGQVDRLTLHAGAPVIRGEKWVATRWMRERAIQPVLLVEEDPASAISTENRS